jgi:glyoxylase-like metal-dependent hydrolase (beta-lactamase superfamily II)
MPQITNLFDGVHLLHGEVGGRPLQLPLLVGPWRSLLIDTGCASDVSGLILPSLAHLGLEPGALSCIITTHCDVDHQGGNGGLKQAAPRALLCCGDADRAQVESPDTIYRLRYDACRLEGIFYEGATRQWMMDQLGVAQPVDLTFRGGERLRLGPDWDLEVLHLPGHSHGHLGVLDRKHRVLFGGDAIHGAVYLDLGGKPALCPTYLHVAAYRQTINFISHLDLEAYCGCHWPVKTGGAIGEFCAESRDFVERAESLILAALRQPRTLRELCLEVGPRLGQWPEPIHLELWYAFAGHLQDLTSRGLVRADAGGPPTRYRLS